MSDERELNISLQKLAADYHAHCVKFKYTPDNPFLFRLMNLGALVRQG